VLLGCVGYVAQQQLVHLEVIVIKELKRQRQEEQEPKTPRKRAANHKKVSYKHPAIYFIPCILDPWLLRKLDLTLHTLHSNLLKNSPTDIKDRDLFTRDFYFRVYGIQIGQYLVMFCFSCVFAATSISPDFPLFVQCSYIAIEQNFAHTHN